MFSNLFGHWYLEAELEHVLMVAMGELGGTRGRPSVPLYLLKNHVLPCLEVLPPRREQLAAGEEHTCIVLADGQLACFGDNSYGQCDPPPGLPPVAAVAAAALHTCALTTDGRLHCFGHNGSGQCDPPRALPPVVAVAAGSFHTCALTTDGRLQCFGNNGKGQCDPPRALPPVVAVAAGNFHTCALTTDGRLHCFGDNSHGQCDPPRGLPPVVAVAVGAYHTCALTTDGRLQCFGNNGKGQCHPPRALPPVVAVAASASHTCALTTDGRLHCFGDNRHGQCDLPRGLGPIAAVAGGSSLSGPRVVDDRLPSAGPVAASAAAPSPPLRPAAGEGGQPSALGGLALASASVAAPRSLEEGGQSANRAASVTQSVEHTEPPAEIHEQEAAVVALQAWAGMVERSIGAAAANDSPGEAPADGGAQLDDILLLDINRNTKGLIEALEAGRPLKACRDALQEEGHEWRLITGTFVFVHPWQYHSAMRALNGRELRRSQIVVSASLEHLVAESIADIGRGAWARDRQPLTVDDQSTLPATSSSSDGPDQKGLNSMLFDSPATSDAWPELTVARTFIATAPRLPSATAVVRSTTEADSRKGPNPRWASCSDDMQ